ncbi:hypothetical protein EES39_27930 [Streptomyces sp. ADI92-24]|nr:hypothetical protein EES39_27930 [Streptomyces sp. ADI92-24]
MLSGLIELRFTTCTYEQLRSASCPPQYCAIAETVERRVTAATRGYGSSGSAVELSAVETEKVPAVAGWQPMATKVFVRPMTRCPCRQNRSPRLRQSSSRTAGLREDGPGGSSSTHGTGGAAHLHRDARRPAATRPYPRRHLPTGVRISHVALTNTADAPGSQRRDLHLRAFPRPPWTAQDTIYNLCQVGPSARSRQLNTATFPGPELIKIETSSIHHSRLGLHGHRVHSP